MVTLEIQEEATKNSQNIIALKVRIRNEVGLQPKVWLDLMWWSYLLYVHLRLNFNYFYFVG